jgi:hypothetical protein
LGLNLKDDQRRNQCEISETGKKKNKQESITTEKFPKMFQNRSRTKIEQM